MRKKNTRDEAFEATLKYFKQDELATNVWINKYALKDSYGNLYEKSPEEMHWRIANEIARMELKYPNPLSAQEIFDTLQEFKYIVPQGGPMSGIGNNFQIVSLSNCFVIGNDQDSYGSIIRTDEEQIQLMKRRGGVGHDLSHLRPSSTPVKNSALTSTGLPSFMERYSNSTREVAQDGRRGALMLSCSIKHPDAKKFMDAKLTAGKVTGANISLRIDDEFMQSAKDRKTYTQQFPLLAKKPLFHQEIDAYEFFKKIVHNAWKSAEPGILFWDTIQRESLPDCYADLGYKTTSTNPCGEIPLCPYDSCRLIALNLYWHVDQPFTPEAKFNFEKFAKHIIIAHRMMDDIIDLELEKIEQVLAKIETDPEPAEIKAVEKQLWLKIKQKCIDGRRTGIGVTAEGDMLAAMGLKYGTPEATTFSTEIHKFLAIQVYKASAICAQERGSFPIFDAKREQNNPFLQRLIEAEPELGPLMQQGRRNIALLTIAPTGSVSLMTQTTSGIEPAFLPVYKRRRKINPNDKNVRVDFTDENGDSWEEYTVFHHHFKTWLTIQGYDLAAVDKMSETQLAEIVKLSPYHKATSNDVDWLEKVKMQGSVQKWVDHSISVTVNLPNSATVELVEQVYMKAWETGCKGVTVYRDGSRSGVLMADTKKEEVKPEIKTVEQIIKDNNAAKRPRLVECEILRFQNNKEKWIGFVGLLDGKPYEAFTGLLDAFQVPTFVEKGWIKKVKEPNGKDENGKEQFKSRYDFVYYDRDGYEQEMRGLSRAFNREYWNIGKMISGVLRHGMPIPNVINLIDSLSIDGDGITSWKTGVKRMLKKYIKEGTTVFGESCPVCGNTELRYQDGCVLCTEPKCGYSKCG